MIELRREEYKTSYLHPRAEFTLTDVSAEMRFDPLTGNRVRVFELDWRTKKVDFHALGGKSAGRCPFCEGVLAQRAARFSPGLCPEGHFTRGSVTLIPNILPYAENAAVAVLTKEHVVPMGAMPAQTVADGFALMLDYGVRVSSHDKRAYEFALLHWNYMPTSGGSIIHPHMQVYITDTALNYHGRILRDARDFASRTGAEFFGAYLDHERRDGARFVCQRGRCALVAPFASRGMLGEFLVVFQESYTYRDITAQDIDDAAALVTDVSRFLDSRNIPGFNLALFSSPLSERVMLNHLRIYPRVFRDIDTFATDIETPTLLYGESFSLVTPEGNARRLREFIAAGGAA